MRDSRDSSFCSSFRFKAVGNALETRELFRYYERPCVVVVVTSRLVSSGLTMVLEKITEFVFTELFSLSLFLFPFSFFFYE